MNYSVLARNLPALEREIARSYEEVRRASAPVFRPYLDTLSEFTLRGGKRFRALLLLGGYRLASRGSLRTVLRAAAALEHFQSWMLIHDDIIDHSDERRGGPTVHRSLERRHRRAKGHGSAEDFGTGVAITLGDLEESFTVSALLSCQVPLSRRHAALEEYTRMTRATALGELLDIESAARPVERVRETDVLLVHELKSAVYTVASPLRLGALLGGGSPALLRDLQSAGLDLGIAFQLRDDVLGAGFDAASAGKSANDLIEGKRTLLVIRAWARGGRDGRRSLASVLGRPHASRREVERARDVIRETGSLAYSERRIQQLTTRALRRIRASPNLTPSGKQLLEDIADRLVRRDR